ncbi:MAG: pectate lyase [Proteiniphilum sp.]|nr:pectate lyase [Proteiniphilum sp.]
MRGILFFRLTTALLLLTVAFSCEKNIPVIERPEQEKPIAEKPDQPGGTTGHTYPTPVTEAALAFPGARGGGIYTSGGRGGKVIRVTTLEDHGLPGSLRHAVNQPGARIVLFDVSGTIRLRSELKITQGNLTLAGQSAPGGGITLADYPVEIQADNMIVRYLRFRMGDKKVTADKDAFGARNRKNLIIDHCSMSWSTDECASFYDNENFTLQWSILSESLRLSVHEKGSHGYGGIWGGVNASFLCNLLIHHDSRTPRFCGSRYSNRPDRESVDFRNNLLYNWGANNAYGAEGGSYNLVNNYYKPGPASSNRGRLLQPYADDGKNAQPKGTHGRFYLSGNQVEGNNSVTVNNRLGVHLHSTFATHAPGVTLDDILAEREFAMAETTTFSATEAYERVLQQAGSSRSRDAIDSRLVEETRTGTTTFKGLNPQNSAPYPKPGIIDSQEDLKPADAGAVWGAWPSLAEGAPPADSDGDGMPDTWEITKGLDPQTADANGRHLSTAYDNIEVYLNELAIIAP